MGEAQRRYNQSPKGKAAQRRANLKFRFGLTVDEYAAMLTKHDGKCAICGTTPDNYSLCIDHDHATGRIRGLLCKPCNLGIAQFNDSIESLHNAIKYLTNDKERNEQGSCDCAGDPGAP